MFIREWVTRGKCLTRKWVYLSWVESQTNHERTYCVEHLDRTLKFPSVFLAQLFVRRYEEGQFQRCREMVAKII